MKRDMELIRNILLLIESQDRAPAFEDFPEAKPTDLAMHLKLLSEAGLTDGYEVHTYSSEMMDIAPTGHIRLTWAGHEFIDAARDPTTWGKAKQQLEAAGRGLGGVTLALLQAVLIDQIKKQLYGQ